MRIAIFSDSYAPVINGVSVSIEMLVEELRERGHSVHIFTSSGRKLSDKDSNICRFPSVELPFVPGYPLAIPPFYPMLRHFRKHTFDIVHTHTPYTIGFVGLRWAESHRLPLVSTYHTLYERYVHYIPFFPRWYTRYKIARHTNYYYNRCAQVIAPSEAAQSSLRRHSVKRPISIIPTGIPAPMKMSKSEARRGIGVRDKEKLLLYVGRVAKEKNLDTLFEMARRVIDEQKHARLIVVGDGPFRKECQAMVRELGIGDRVQFFGLLPRKEIDKFYVASDVFVFSSVTETQGLVIGEAMSHGLPAVAVRGGGASAAIVNGENGFIVGNSPAQFAAVVLDLLQNPALLGRMSHAARVSVKTWTSADACDKVLETYEAALTSGPPQFAVVYDAALADAHSRKD